MTETQTQAAIEVGEDGPYHVTGGVPLKRARKVPGERKGTFEGYEVYEDCDAPDEYWLCRCGKSDSKPFCSGAHSKVGFDGTETAPTDDYRSRAEVLGGTQITVRDDRSICAHAAFCSNAATNVWKAAKGTDDDAALQATVIDMVEHCPSGALTYDRDGTPTEPDLPQEIWVLEDGNYIVRGNIPITRSDGQPIEVRNRMSLCRCGDSKIKPLCDGTHNENGFTDG